MLVENRIAASLPADLIADATARELTMADVRRVADGLDAAVAQGAMSDARPARWTPAHPMCATSLPPSAWPLGPVNPTV